ncbi:MAG: hypothetical protein IH840_16895 [Candidatus Heimdallarchaeota archaeon]|nr:hypothetical protein [Candidatus Heimdallarchaeota archaeon]
MGEPTLVKSEVIKMIEVALDDLEDENKSVVKKIRKWLTQVRRGTSLLSAAFPPLVVISMMAELGEGKMRTQSQKKLGLKYFEICFAMYNECRESFGRLSELTDEKFEKFELQIMESVESVIQRVFEEPYAEKRRYFLNYLTKMLNNAIEITLSDNEEYEVDEKEEFFSNLLDFLTIPSLKMIAWIYKNYNDFRMYTSRHNETILLWDKQILKIYAELGRTPRPEIDRSINPFTPEDKDQLLRDWIWHRITKEFDPGLYPFYVEQLINVGLINRQYGTQSSTTVSKTSPEGQLAALFHNEPNILLLEIVDRYLDKSIKSEGLIMFGQPSVRY